MKITEGTFTPHGGNPVAITGTVDVPGWLNGGQSSFTYFAGMRMDILLDGFAPIAIMWEASASDRLELSYNSSGGDDGKHGVGTGLLDYIGSYDPSLHKAEIESWKALEFNIRYDVYPDMEPFSLNLKAEAVHDTPSSREIYMIEKYSFSIDLTENQIGQIGQFSLWDKSTRLADFRVKLPGVAFTPFKFSSDGVLRGDVSVEKRDAIIDLLRNEGPIRLLVWHDGTPERVISGVRIATDTAKLEPVGDGEA